MRLRSATRHLCVLSFVTLLAACGSTPTAEQPVQELKLIAHRGGVVDDETPENSRASLQRAIADDYYMVHLPVRATEDLTAVVHRGGDLQRYGDSRKLEKITWNEAKALRCQPGDHALLKLRDALEVAKDYLHVMLDIRAPEGDPVFYKRLVSSLQRRGMLERAIVVGLPEARDSFRDRARVGVNRVELARALQRGEDLAQRYVLFEPGQKLDDATVRWAQSHGVTVVPSIHVAHYWEVPGDHMELATRDIQRLRGLGVLHLQIDSVYADLTKTAMQSQPR